MEKKGKGLGPGSAGQSGDTQGLSEVAQADSESIAELVEEGQYFEAEVISGMQQDVPVTPDGDVAELTVVPRKKAGPGQ